MPFAPPKHKPGKLVGAVRHVVRVEERVWRGWYKLALWTKRLRPNTMHRDGYACRMCGKNWGHDTSRLVVDHREPHRGDWDKFKDPDNLQSLCDHPCHSKHKQRMEQF